MHDLPFSTYAVVLTLPLAALVAFGAGWWFGRRDRRAPGAGDRTAAGVDALAVRRGNEALRSAVFASCLAAGTTASLLVSGGLPTGVAALGALAALSAAAAACAWALTRAPHANAARDVAHAVAWWLAFGFLAGLTAQVLIGGGLVSAAVLIAAVGVAGANALARDGGLAVDAVGRGGSWGEGRPS